MQLHVLNNRKQHYSTAHMKRKHHTHVSYRRHTRYTQTDPACKYCETHGATCDTCVESRHPCGQQKSSLFFFLLCRSAASLSVKVSVDLRVSADITVVFVNYTRLLDQPWLHTKCMSSILQPLVKVPAILVNYLKNKYKVIHSIFGFGRPSAIC